MNIITAYATKNHCYKVGKKLTPKGIVVHSTGANNPNLKRYVDCVAECGVNQYGNHWNTYHPGGRQVCVHSFIGYDKNKAVSVANILPYNIACWGCGSGRNGSFNDSHIQFEICEDDLTNSAYFNAVWACAVEYCAILCKQYNLDPTGENVIVGHCEAYKAGYASNHGDPVHWFKRHGKTMDDFRKAVKAKMGAGTSAPAGSSALYRVQVGAFSSKTNAEIMRKKLVAAGYSALIVQAGKLYRVQVGAFSKKANADAMLAKLQKGGFGGFVFKVNR
jgi:hypothetical protein